MARVWRLLLDPAADGRWNMAVDEALLATAQAGGPPALRLYGWRGPWLSLGYAQVLPASSAEACGRVGVGVIRRITGGSAVLHGADLTYAVAAPESELPAGLQASYALVGRALLRALHGLGVAAHVAAHSSVPRAAAPFDCFARAGGDEICVAGRKLAGSAQRRSGGGLLQHGSLRLASDPPQAARAAGSVPGAATSLAELGVSMGEAALRARLVAAFEAELGVRFVADTLGAAEHARALERAAARAEKPWRAGPSPASVPSRPPLAGR